MVVAQLVKRSIRPLTVHGLNPVTSIFYCTEKTKIKKQRQGKGGSPGLVVMGGDSCYEGYGSKPSSIYLLDGHFCIFVSKV